MPERTEAPFSATLAAAGLRTPGESVAQAHASTEALDTRPLSEQLPDVLPYLSVLPIAFAGGLAVGMVARGIRMNRNARKALAIEETATGIQAFSGLIPPETDDFYEYARRQGRRATRKLLHDAVDRVTNHPDVQVLDAFHPEHPHTKYYTVSSPKEPINIYRVDADPDVLEGSVEIVDKVTSTGARWVQLSATGSTETELVDRTISYTQTPQLLRPAILVHTSEITLPLEPVDECVRGEPSVQPEKLNMSLEELQAFQEKILQALPERT